MIVLDSIEHDSDRYRQYVIGIQTCLFGGVYLTTSWGRADGSRLQRKEYWFATEDEAFVKARSVLKTRIRHNYQVVSEGRLLERIQAQ
ncbi:MAG TPA: WGR domain-containing protein [Deltaproteobacteria bacterium]|nr:WGR domain-containing protein [Deltaproteobacteria bacterium]HPR56620.1 WGR domain-containing protein [Deltaproteobacteria bacterium]HXK47924.1 WGR domain-containing protein [Deltaproteobacteria bacterium]